MKQKGFSLILENLGGKYNQSRQILLPWHAVLVCLWVGWPLLFSNVCWRSTEGESDVAVCLSVSHHGMYKQGTLKAAPVSLPRDTFSHADVFMPCPWAKVYVSLNRLQSVLWHTTPSLEIHTHRKFWCIICFWRGQISATSKSSSEESDQ